MSVLENLSGPLERWLGRLSPRWAASRARDRFRTSLLERVGSMVGPSEARRYQGASSSDRLGGWSSPLTSANVEVAQGIDRLRSRSRDLVRNDGWANTAKRRLVSNAVGEGIRVEIKHPNAELAKRVQADFDAWAESTDCDADGNLNFYGLQALALGEVVEAGDSLMRRRWRRPEDGLKIPLQLQLIEPEHMDASRDTLGATAAGSRILRGIEFNARRKRVRYWLFREHPGEAVSGSFDSVAVPASEIAHAYRVERSGQVSGVPWGAPVIVALRDLGDWKDATMVRLKAAACLMAFVTGIEPDDTDDASALAGVPGATTMNPGSIEYLQHGQTVSFSQPPGVTNVDAFAVLVLREVAAAYGLPYEVLTGDLNKVNFSSGRLGWLEFQRELGVWRRDVLINRFCDPAFRWFLAAMVVAGRITPEELDGFSAWWTPPRRQLFDPAKEVPGIVAAIRAGLTTQSEEQRAGGWTPSELRAEFAADLAANDELGIPFSCDPRQPLSGPNGASSSAAESAKSEDGDSEKETDGDDEKPSE